jgi:hypothetical protein
MDTNGSFPQLFRITAMNYADRCSEEACLAGLPALLHHSRQSARLPDR